MNHKSVPIKGMGESACHIPEMSVLYREMDRCLAVNIPQRQFAFAFVLAEPNCHLEVTAPAAPVHEREAAVVQHDFHLPAHRPMDVDPFEDVVPPFLARPHDRADEADGLQLVKKLR